ncbi:MAG: TonB-dependent receptor [Acidobacteria bacterium]|nr:MAG: TonB-dependent receptor [Acidobacteriota bacterium]
MRQTTYWIAVALALALASLAPVAAQVLTSPVSGTVTDQSGGVVPDATVTLTNVQTNAAETVVTNDSGAYTFPQVLPGVYNVSAELPGFKRARVEQVRVEVSTPATVDLRMEVGGVTEEVVVTGSQGQTMMNTVNAEINTIVDRARIEELPLNGRNVADLALLQAGVTGSGEIAREASVNGMRGTFNNMTLDGVNNQDNFIRTDAFFGVIPLRESFVEEFNLTTSNADVDAGNGASQTLMVTRSGSNDFHGQLFYYHRNDALNANTFFNNATGLEKATVRNHQYGGSLGGRIIPDKLFFFVNYEQERDPATTPVARIVPTEAARLGNFTYDSGNAGLQTVNLFQLTGVTPDPEVQSLLNLIPAPNDPSLTDDPNLSGFRFNSPAKNDSDWLNIRMDFEPWQNHAFTASFHQFTLDIPNSPSNDIDARFPGLPGAGQESTRRLGSASWRASLTPTITNELRFGVQWAPVDFTTQESFQRGYQILFSDASLGESDLFENPIQNFTPQGRNAPVYDLLNNMSWVTGNHAFKFGGNYRALSVDQYATFGVIPQYILGFGTGNEDPLDPGMFPGGIAPADLAVASEMLGILGGYVRTGQQTFNVTSRTSGFVQGAREDRLIKQNFFSVFGGDTWRLRPDLTLNYGLRWEFHGVPTEDQGLALLPVGGSEAVLDPNAVVDFAGGDTGRDFFENDWNNFAPNVGLAWRPWSSTVFRGGYSIAYVVDNNITTVTNALAGNAGLSQQQVIPEITGTLSGGGRIPVDTPEFQVPRTAMQGVLADPAAALFAIDPNLRVPYVQQWNIGIQHELFRDTYIEARYVGNRGIKLTRAIDVNQVRFPAEFVEDFRRAQRNLAANNDPLTGEELTFFPQLGGAAEFFMGNNTVRNWIRNGEIGSYVGNLLALNRDFFFAGWGGEEFGSTVEPGAFLANPNTFVADIVQNNAFSRYNALQVEVRRRYRQGFTGQFNYTFGKVLTNFAGSQTNFRGYFDNAQQNLEIMRPDYDISHTFNGNFVWDLPVGAGRAFDTSGVLDAIIGGWSLNSIVRVRSGEPINIVSERGTINRGGSRSTTNTVHMVGLDIAELQERTGIFRDDRGRILLFDPSLIDTASGRANPQFFQNPGLLEAGTLALSPVSGPWYSNTDVGIRKSFRLPITEDSRVQVRFDVFNVFNRTNFAVLTQPSTARGNDPLGILNRHNINSTSFGVIDDTFSARQMQVGLKVVF